MKRRQIVISVALVTVMIVLWQRHLLKVNEWIFAWNLDDIASVELLIKKFELTVFRNDYEEQGFKNDHLLTKWKNSIRVRFRGESPKRFATHVENTLDVLSRFSGLIIRRNDDANGERANMDFYIVPPDRVGPILSFHGRTEKQIARRRNAICLAIVEHRHNVGDYAVVVIFNTLNDKMVEHCIIEEFTQALGLIADTDILQPSIMSDQVPIIDRLPLNDKIMLRTLYDKRLKSGMTRDEAMPIVRMIIPELVQGVEERGEQALYQ